MKTIAIGSIFVLLAIVVGVTGTTPAFADHMQANVSIPAGSSTPGCDETNECFVPNEVTVDVGGEVIWTNDDTAAHTVTSGTATDGPDGTFDSSLFMAGTTFSHKFDTAGTFPYFCMVHPWMSGTVIVQEDTGDEHHDEMSSDTGDELMVMKGDASATGMLSDSTKVSVWTSTPTKGEMMEVDVEFKGAEHVNYDLKVTQNGNTVLNDMGAHKHDGKGAHMTKALSSSDPVDITITFQGYGVDDPKTGPIGEVVKFSKVVPEFGTIAMMILAVSIISIIAVTAKSRVIPRL